MQTEITIIIYFAAVLAIGIYSAFKIKTPGDYFVAGRKAGQAQVSGSLLATILGGSAILGTIELSREIGWAALWFLFSAAAGLLVLIPLSKRVKRFGNYTLPEMVGSFYGRRAEVISSAIIPVAWLGIVAAQIIAAAKIISELGVAEYGVAAIIAGAVFIVYTLLGGQLSILKTDALQAGLIIAGLAALVLFSINGAGAVNYERFTFGSLFNASFTGFDLLILLLTYSVTFVVGPDIYSRLFCAKNEKTAARSILIVAVVLIPVSVALTYLGVVSGETAGGGIVSFAGNLLPGWAYGLFIAALLSAVMSSADTTLLTSAMIVNELFTGDLNGKKSMRQTRRVVVVLGIASIVIALFVTSIIQSLLFALAFFSGAFVVPVLAGLLNIKVNQKRVVYAIIAGGLIALTGKIINVFVDEIAGNLIVVAAYLINAGMLFFGGNGEKQSRFKGGEF
jgi:SSS family solute:Na+ symporter